MFLSIVPSFLSFHVKMEAATSSETSPTTYKTTVCYKDLAQCTESREYVTTHAQYRCALSALCAQKSKIVCTNMQEAAWALGCAAVRVILSTVKCGLIVRRALRLTSVRVQVAVMKG